jgi:hypothetical protein
MCRGGKAAAQVSVKTFYAGSHALGVQIVYDFGDAKDRANKGYHIWYRVAGHGEAPPARKNWTNCLPPRGKETPSNSTSRIRGRWCISRCGSRTATW